MRKRLFIAIAIAVLLALTAACLAACNTNKVHIYKIYLEYADGTTNDDSVVLGEFSYGTRFADIEPEYKVMCLYSDNSKKELATSEYKVTYTYNPIGGAGVPIDKMPEFPDVGYYEITFLSGDYHTCYGFIINPSDREYRVTFSTRSWTYIDAPQVSVTYADELTEVAENINYYYIDKEIYDNFTDEEKANFADKYFSHEDVWPIQNGVPSQIVPGTYYAFAYIPACGNYNEAVSVIDGSTTFTVTKASITRKEVYFDNAKIYVGNYSPLPIELSKVGIFDRVEFVGPNEFGGSTLFYIYDENEMPLLDGSLEWADGTITVSEEDIGKRFDVVFVPHPYYEEYFNTIDITGYVIMN